MQTPSRKTKAYHHDTSQYQEQCVCQICVCGQHQCPEPGISNLPFEGETTNHHDYKPYKISTATRALSPSRNIYQSKHYNPEVLTSTYKNSYSPPKPEPWANNSHNRSKWNEYKAGQGGRFYDDTEYKDNYKDKQIIPDSGYQQKQGKNSYIPNPTKFEGTTTYTAEFSPKKTSDANMRSYKPVSGMQDRHNLPFDDYTTYKNDYLPFSIESNPRIKTECSDHLQQNKTKFEGQSHYKADYKPYEVQGKRKCPVQQLPKIPRQCSPGKTHMRYSPQKNKWM